MVHEPNRPIRFRFDVPLLPRLREGRPILGQYYLHQRSYKDQGRKTTVFALMSQGQAKMQRLGFRDNVTRKV
jgi:hypothetical protein